MHLIVAVGIFGLVAVEQLVAGSDGRAATSAESFRKDINGDVLPDGGLARIGTARWRCGAFVSPLLGFSPDGKRIISVGRVGSYHWDAATGRLLRLVQRRHGVENAGSAIKYGVLSGDTGTAAFWAVAAIRLWDTASGDERVTIPWQDKERIRFPQLALSSNGRLLAMWPDVDQHNRMGDSSPISLWDARTGLRRGLLTGHAVPVTSLTFTHDGRTLLSVGEDRALCAWDVASGTRRFRVEMPQSDPHANLAVSADDKMVAICSQEFRRPKTSNVLALRDLADGKLIHRLQPEPTGVGACAFSSDGRLLALCQGGCVSLWDLRNGQKCLELEKPAGTDVQDVIFAPDSRSLAGRSIHSPRIRLWDVPTGRELPTPAGHDNAVSSLVFTNQGSKVLTHSDDGTLKLWNAETGALLGLVTENGEQVAAIAPSFDRKKITSLDTSSNRVRVWDADTGRACHSVVINLAGGEPEQPIPPQLCAMTLAPAGDMLFTAVRRFVGRPGGWSFDTRAWDLHSGKLANSWRGGRDGAVLFSPDGRLAVSGWGVVRDTATAKEVCRLDFAAQGRVLQGMQGEIPGPAAFSRDGRLLATVASHSVYDLVAPDEEHHTAQVWELATRRVVFAVDSPEDVDSCATFSDDGRLLISGGSTAIVMWDIASGQRLLERRGPFGDVTALAVSPDGRRLATAFSDTTVLVWDLERAALHRQHVVPANNGVRTPGEMKALWVDLGSPDARRGQSAVSALVAAPEKAAPWLGAQLQLVKVATAERIKRLVGDLDSVRFQDRENAFQELRDLDRQAESVLRHALNAKPSAETRSRIDKLLAAMRSEPTPIQLRETRALQALEAIATPAAINVLKRLAKGRADARLTREARLSLQRVLSSAR